MRVNFSASEILAHLRQIIFVLDEVGTILHVTGSSMGMLGYEADELVGRNAIDFVAPSHVEPMAFIFTGPGDHVIRNQHAAFSIGLIAADGNQIVAECGAERTSTADGVIWVVSLMPDALRSASFHAMAAHSHGASSVDVARTVAEHLSWRYDSTSDIRAFVMTGQTEATFDSVVEPYSAHRPVALLDALTIDIGARAPWNDPHDAPHVVVDIDALPPSTAAAARELGYVVACIAIAQSQDGQRIGLVLFGGHRYAFIGNVEVVIDESVHTIELTFERERSAEILRAAAEQDALTGLSNRHVFTHELECRQTRLEDMALLYIDLDGFKAVNDTYGHSVGDAVLIEVANRIKSMCQPDDIAARLGGDEFAVLLAEHRAADAVALSDRLLERIAEPLNLDVGPERVHACGGLALSIGGLDIVERADLAMLQGKRSGRSRLVVV